MAQATLRLLTDATLFAETRRRAYQYAKPMFWPNVGRQYLDFFAQVVAESQKTSVQPVYKNTPHSSRNRHEELLQRGT